MSRESASLRPQGLLVRQVYFQSALSRWLVSATAIAPALLPAGLVGVEFDDFAFVLRDEDVAEGFFDFGRGDDLERAFFLRPVNL